LRPRSVFAPQPTRIGSMIRVSRSVPVVRGPSFPSAWHGMRPLDSGDPSGPHSTTSPRPLRVVLIPDGPFRPSLSMNWKRWSSLVTRSPVPAGEVHTRTFCCHAESSQLDRMRMPSRRAIPFKPRVQADDCASSVFRNWAACARRNEHFFAAIPVILPPRGEDQAQQRHRHDAPTAERTTPRRFGRKASIIVATRRNISVGDADRRNLCTPQGSAGQVLFQEMGLIDKRRMGVPKEFVKCKKSDAELYLTRLSRTDRERLCVNMHQPFRKPVTGGLGWHNRAFNSPYSVPFFPCSSASLPPSPPPGAFSLGLLVRRRGARPTARPRALLSRRNATRSLLSVLCKGELSLDTRYLVKRHG